MTKFILHGGFAGRDTDKNKKFFETMAESLKNDANILIVSFAKEEDKQQEHFDLYCGRINAVVPGNDFNFFLATDDGFAKQIKKADVIYIHGGSRLLLDPKVKRVKNFIDLVRGKVVAGDSAGANVLAKYYYDNNYNDVGAYFEGVGVLPIKTYCHYGQTYGKTKEDIKKIFEGLKNFGEDLPVYTLPEEEFVTIEQ